MPVVVSWIWRLELLLKSLQRFRMILNLFIFAVFGSRSKSHFFPRFFDFLVSQSEDSLLIDFFEGNRFAKPSLREIVPRDIKGLGLHRLDYQRISLFLQLFFSIIDDHHSSLYLFSMTLKVTKNFMAIEFALQRRFFWCFKSVHKHTS